jgi:hypothetical protein
MRSGANRPGINFDKLEDYLRNMTVLLTSAGFKNASIHNAVFDLLGKRIAE